MLALGGRIAGRGRVDLRRRARRRRRPGRCRAQGSPRRCEVPLCNGPFVHPYIGHSHASRRSRSSPTNRGQLARVVRPVLGGGSGAALANHRALLAVRPGGCLRRPGAAATPAASATRCRRHRLDGARVRVRVGGGGWVEREVVARPVGEPLTIGDTLRGPNRPRCPPRRARGARELPARDRGLSVVVECRCGRSLCMLVLLAVCHVVALASVDDQETGSN